MFEKIKTISNPLTIIAIFAALAEVAGASTLFALNLELQKTFIWFVMGFPSLLVCLFFLTLNFNPKVLYAPSDFRDEGNFLHTLRGKDELALSFDELTEQLEMAKGKIIQEVSREVGVAGAKEKEELVSLISKQLEVIKARVETARESAEDLTLPSLDKLPHSSLQAAILAFLSVSPGEVSLQQIARHVRMSEEATNRAIGKLVRRELVQELSAEKFSASKQ